MKLITRCISCKKDINIKSSAATRGHLQMEKGDEFNVNCTTCRKIQKKHVNEIRAEINQNIILIGIGIGILVTLILWNLYGMIGGISFGIPLFFWYQQMDAIKAFNSYTIRRR